MLSPPTLIPGFLLVTLPAQDPALPKFFVAADPTPGPDVVVYFQLWIDMINF